MLRRLAFTALGLLIVLAAVLWLRGSGRAGVIDGVRLAPAAPRIAAAQIAQSDAQRRAAQGSVGRDPSQILFGDLHVHSTLSGDAFFINLPLIGGAGALLPADACDFARHCAALDFWSINDHANSLYPEDWRNTVEAIRACNARAGDPANPDVVAFLGWEWTQAGLTPDSHYGHKNVVLAHTDDARIPTRPIAAKVGTLPLEGASPWVRGAASLLDGRFADLSRRIVSHADAEVCGPGPVRTLPADCREVAPTPPELFAKLDDWGHEAIVIPHGTSWGVYTPPTSSWSKQLEGAMHDPDRQTMLELYSGHGDSEVYRDWRAASLGPDGELVCPEARDDYLPVCQRAGELILERCRDEGLADAECEARADEARRFAAEAGKNGSDVVENTSPEDWLDAGQCRDCNQPAFNYVPTGSAQYIAALGNFDEDPAAPRRFRMGFMASSDNHSARPGTGYKELRAHGDGGQDDPEGQARVALATSLQSSHSSDERPSRARAVQAGETSPLSAIADFERVTSFQYTGGLVAVHSRARDREAIWQALEDNEVYGTSGPRILLWFDLVTDAGPLPMGSEVEVASAPDFRVRAVGSFEQKPGCPDSSIEALGAEQVARLCVGECYHPSDERRPISRIEIVRIRPQVSPDEDVASLIDDPWRSFDCDGDRSGCEASFRDEEYLQSGRDAVYYARVFETPSPTVNGSPLRCEYDDAGRCIRSNPCDHEGPCLQPDAARAWSSPIYVDHPKARRSR